MEKRSANYLRYLPGLSRVGAERTGEILAINPTITPSRTEAEKIHVSVYDYSADTINTEVLENINSTFSYKERDTVSWINIDGIRKNDVEAICAHYGVHALIVEDILSIGSCRPPLWISGVFWCHSPFRCGTIAV